MSKFNNYARRLDNAAKKIFSEYQEAEAAFNAAESAKSNGPQLGRWRDAQTEAQVARLEADYLEAKAAFDDARRRLPERGRKETQEIRAELVRDIKNGFTVDPAKVDIAALELMKSGVCGAADYEKMMSDADREANTTMIRLVASYAKKAYEAARESKAPVGQEELARLYDLGQRGADYAESVLLNSFDTLADIFQRAMNNSAMIDHWGELTSSIIEAF